MLFVFVLMHVALSSDESEQYNIFPQQNQLHLDKLFNSFSVLEDDMSRSVSQFSKLFKNVMDQYEKEQQHEEVGQKINWDGVVVNTNRLIDLIEAGQLRVHEFLQKSDLSDPQLVYDYGGYIVLLGLVLKFISVKKILKFMIS